MAKPEECSVCYTAYNDSERRPRTLPCGHTFCSECVGGVIEDGHLSCPTCHAHHTATSLTQFPVNYTVEALVKELNSVHQDLEDASAGRGVTVAARRVRRQMQSSAASEELPDHQQEQVNSLRVLLDDCQGPLRHLYQYQGYVEACRSPHINLNDELTKLLRLNQEALHILDEEKYKVLAMVKEGEQKQQRIANALEGLNTSDSTQEGSTVIETVDRQKEEIETWTQNCQKQFPDVTTLTSYRKMCETIRTGLDTVAAEAGVAGAPIPTLLPNHASTIMKTVQNIMVSGLSLSVSDVCRMRQPAKSLMEAGLVLAVQQDKGSLRSSRITLENGRVYLHCLLERSPSANACTLKLSDMMKCLDPFSTLAFLDLSWGGLTRGRVHIRLSPDTPLARQFALLCTGQRGPSYLNTTLFHVANKGCQNEIVVGGDYQYNSGEGGAMMLPHTRDGYWRSGRVGVVFSPVISGGDSQLRPDDYKGAQFAFCTRECRDGGFLGPVFGEVESGLEVVRAAVKHTDIKQVTVVDCGVILPRCQSNASDLH